MTIPAADVAQAAGRIEGFVFALRAHVAPGAVPLLDAVQEQAEALAKLAAGEAERVQQKT